ncbi:hypothetical protein [Cytobacillus solani]|uniref:Uncharacterized protein n=1 Tax=Cytobacillus solani TaxID=1637975 RepID=A0A0Q3QM60_9BACI|nr:hypothetical protein [Cytobacillus solani]KQL18830.1 hypothetical protein AN957_09770 [Cytobacillus solani]
MGLIILAVIVGTAAAVLLAIEIHADSFGEWFVSAMLGFMIGLLTLLLGILPSFVYDTSPATPSKQEIHAIKDNNEVHGNFALGFGSVDEEQYYYYVIEDVEGFKSIEKTKVSKSKIKEDANDQPYILTYKHRFNSAFARFMYGEYSGSYSYEIHVPKNTITTEFNIDLE